jgi:hypothetical protein
MSCSIHHATGDMGSISCRTSLLISLVANNSNSLEFDGFLSFGTCGNEKALVGISYKRTPPTDCAPKHMIRNLIMHEHTTGKGFTDLGIPSSSTE